VQTEITSVVLDAAGVGYLIHTSKPGIDLKLESQRTFWAHLAVRETALDLYDFVTLAEYDYKDSDPDTGCGWWMLSTGVR